MVKEKGSVVLIGSESQIKEMIDNESEQKRFSSLSERIKEAGIYDGRF